MKLVAGNWKMNGLRASASMLSELVAGLATAPAAAEVLVCPPATLLVPFAGHLKGTPVSIHLPVADVDAAFARALAAGATAVMPVADMF